MKFTKSLKLIFSEMLSLYDEPKNPYPATVEECIDDNLKYRPGVIKAIKRFRSSRPWHGTLQEKQGKFLDLNAELAKACGIPEPIVTFVKWSPMGACHINTKPSLIVLEHGNSNSYSVVTFLHEFAHALGKGERGACRWSLNLFKRFFPLSYQKLEPRGHVLYKKKNEDGDNTNKPCENNTTVCEGEDKQSSTSSVIEKSN